MERADVRPAGDQSEPAPGIVTVAALTTLFVGMLSTISGAGHLYGVIETAAKRADYTYDFRFASLVLIGILIPLAGLMCLEAVPGVAGAQRPAWGRARSASLLLILVTVPFIPVQPGLAGALAVLGTVNLIALQGARSRLNPG